MTKSIHYFQTKTIMYLYSDADIGYLRILKWWLDFNLHLVLFTQYILNTISIAYMYMYICII